MEETILHDRTTLHIVTLIPFCKNRYEAEDD